MFGGAIDDYGTASERGISNEVRNEATNFINTMMKEIIEDIGPHRYRPPALQHVTALRAQPADQGQASLRVDYL